MSLSTFVYFLFCSVTHLVYAEPLTWSQCSTAHYGMVNKEKDLDSPMPSLHHEETKGKEWTEGS